MVISYTTRVGVPQVLRLFRLDSGALPVSEHRQQGTAAARGISDRSLGETGPPWRDDQRYGLRPDWNLWQHVHHEISSNRAELTELRDWFVRQADARRGVPLGLPLLHEALLWLCATGQWPDAHADGLGL